MSVLINMEMPTSCEDCPMCHSNAEYDYAYCCVSSAETSGNKIPSDCPLIPVPPHGRCIDADEFLKRAIDTKCFRGDYALMLEELVEESTTIIPADPAEEGE